MLKRDRLAFRRKCQIVFQNPYDTFDPRLKIENVLLSTLRLHKIGANAEEQLKIVKGAESIRFGACRNLSGSLSPRTFWRTVTAHLDPEGNAAGTQLYCL